MDSAVLLRAKRIAKLPLPYVVSYRLFTSLVSFCYTHYALSCDMSFHRTAHLNMLSLPLWCPKGADGCVAKLSFLLLHPVIFYLPTSFLIIDTLLNICFILNRPIHTSVHTFHNCGTPLSILNGVLFPASVPPLNTLVLNSKILSFLLFIISLIRLMTIFMCLNTSYGTHRQFYFAKNSQRRQNCSLQTHPIDVDLTRTFYLPLHNPIHQSFLRYVLTGSLDHSHRLCKSNLISSPICPHCNTHDETAEHIFWYCSRWKHVRDKYPTLLRLFSFMGTQWPNCFLHCGWIEQTLIMGFS